MSNAKGKAGKGKGDPHHDHTSSTGDTTMPEEAKHHEPEHHIATGYAEGSHPPHEREFETGMSEAFTQSSINKDRLYTSNDKRTYDVHQDLDLERARNNNRHVNVLDQIAQQALQNAVETANMVGKNSLNLLALGGDRMWNVNETDAIAAVVTKALDNTVPLRATDAAVAKSTDTSVQIQAIAAAVAAAVAATLNPE